ncbi:MAG TPA: DUF2092 domain-containing protein [Candidatus Angelobacter sp.]|nr:DUF2092 domain-containing protein [Candidatus Angelobacter sp.]
MARRFTVAAAVVALSLMALAVEAQTAAGQGAPRVDPKAVDQLKKCTSYLGSAKTLALRASYTDEVVLLNGEKIGTESWAQISLQRPNHFRTVRHGVKEDLDFYFDGKAMSIYEKGPNFYATVPAPSSFDGMMDVLNFQYDVGIPGSDLFYSDAYAGMMDGVTDASYIGLEEVNGVPAHHLAFRKSDVDWQLWVRDGDMPVPVKYVITTKWVTAAPSYTVFMTDWNMSPKFESSTFDFVPPAGARQIEFVRPADVPGAR